MHIGIKAYDLPAEVRPPVNLVLLIDVSGSMASADKLELAKRSFALMLDKLQPSDTIGIVTYAGNSGVALPPTSLEHKERILSVINSLRSGGSTAGAAGLATAYELAKQNFRKEGVNRILLATDGDFNVGVSAPGGIAEYVAQQRSSGVFLSVLGFGMGNYQDTTMQAIAQNGNGVAAYIDSISEARRVLSDQIGSTMFTVAKDVKFQVEFNPAAIKGYRLLGYETRALRREDFDNDKVDAGEVGAGHEVTAIYELVPVGATMPADASLRYQAPAPAAESSVAAAEPANELAFLRIRYKLPESDTSTLIERPVTRADVKGSVSEASTDVRFATAVAGYSRLLRRSSGLQNFSYADVITLAQSARGEDPSGERSRFIELVKNTQALAGAQPQRPEEGGVAFPPPQ
jgi:Ca-activated chloride channel family protein